MPDLEVIATVAGSVIAGAVIALKVIAPRTKTVYDDKALSFLEKLGALVGLVTVKPAVKVREKRIDHR